MSITERRVASSSEVEEALGRLSDADMVRLKRIAQLRCAGLKDVEWTDLLQEAFRRALGGERRWPRPVPFVAFLAQTMRSLASEHWRQSTATVAIAASDLWEGSESTDDSALDRIARNDIHPEREIAARSTLEYLEQLFKNDTEALAVIRGLGEGLTPAEIQEQAKMSQVAYATAQRRIRRKTAKFLSESQT